MLSSLLPLPPPFFLLFSLMLPPSILSSSSSSSSSSSFSSSSLHFPLLFLGFLSSLLFFSLLLGTSWRGTATEQQACSQGGGTPGGYWKHVRHTGEASVSDACTHCTQWDRGWRGRGNLYENSLQLSTSLSCSPTSLSSSSTSLSCSSSSVSVTSQPRLQVSLSIARIRPWQARFTISLWVDCNIWNCSVVGREKIDMQWN